MQNEKFKRALAEALIPEYENSIPQTEEHEFSAEFEKKMNKLIRRQKKPYYMLVNTAAKRAACIAVCVAIASSAAVMSSSALRERFADFFMDIFTDHSVVTPAESDAEAPEIIEEKYEITYDLSDYEIIFYKANEKKICISYKNDNNVIDFSQHIKSDYNISWNTEGTAIETVKLKDYEAIYFYNNEYHTLIWETEDYIFSIDTTVGKSELIELAESVQKVEKI